MSVRYRCRHNCGPLLKLLCQLGLPTFDVDSSPLDSLECTLVAESALQTTASEVCTTDIASEQIRSDILFAKSKYRVV